MSTKKFKEDLQFISCDRAAKRKLEFFIFQQRVHSTRKQITFVFFAGAFAGAIEPNVVRFILSLLC